MSLILPKIEEKQFISLRWRTTARRQSDFAVIDFFSVFFVGLLFSGDIVSIARQVENVYLWKEFHILTFTGKLWRFVRKSHKG